MEITETSSDILLISLGVLGLLFLASIGGEVLRARLSADENHPTVETYLTRVHSWWFMAGVAAVAAMTGPWAITLLFAFASFAALREFLTLTRRGRADHWALIGAFYVMLPGQYLSGVFQPDGPRHHADPGLRFSLPADPFGPARRGQEVHGADFRNPMGTDDLRILRLSCSDASGVGDRGLCRPDDPAHRLADPCGATR